ncbi:MAG: energy transducer TonB [Burkholderiales bacterium]|nr:energy transducer TonB [Burkholderiales bacterium]
MQRLDYLTLDSERLLAWSVAASIAVHAAALFLPWLKLGALTVAPHTPAPALEARLVPLPPPAKPEPAPPPTVLKDTLDRPDLEKAQDPIKKAPRRRLAEDAPPRPERKPPPPKPSDDPTRNGPDRPLDLRVPSEERAAVPERLTGGELREALGRLSEEIFYPPEALQRGLEGEVVILVRVGEGGAILDASVASGSGHAMLDEAAVRAVRRLGRLSPSTANRTILLPVRFRIM